MHVGHLRSTIIGDAVVRTLEFLGHNVIRANHLGDWGTQFGMLIANLERHEAQGGDISMDLSDIEGFYRESKALYDEDEEFAKTARNYVVRLQSGDEYCKEKWQQLVKITLEQNQRNYDRLNVSLTDKDVMGESMYNSMLAGIVEDLKAKGLAVEDDGAVVVFLDEYKNKDGELWVLSSRSVTAASCTPPPISRVRNTATKRSTRIACCTSSTHVSTST